MSKTTLVAEPGTHEIVVTREFDAPRELVYKLITDPELIAEWWSPVYMATVIDTMDVRPGGQWRIVMSDPDGNEYAFRGVYHSVDFPGTLIKTSEWEGMPGHVQLETITLEALPDGTTKLVDQSVFQSAADRDLALMSGMEEGAHQIFERLSELIGQAQAAEA